MRHTLRLVAAATVAGLGVTACGGATNVLQGKSPQQIMTLASASISSASYHMTMHGTMAIDASGIAGLPPSALSQLTTAFKDITIDGHADVQSPQRVRMTVTMKPLVDKSMVMVLYDGTAYLSQDGGSTFADIGGFNFEGLPVSPTDTLKVLQDVGQVTDVGPTTRNGTHVEKMHATLGSDYVSKIFSGISGSGQIGQVLQQLGQLFAQVMQLKDGTVDAYVRSGDGKLDSTDTHVTITLDMGKFMSLLSQALGGASASGSGGTTPNVSGSMTMQESATSTFTDYGAKITVTKPTVDPNAPGLPSGGLSGA